MEPVWYCRFPGCSLARHGLQHGSDATSPARTDSVLLRALALHCAHHTFGATEEIASSSTVAKHRVNSGNQAISPATRLLVKWRCFTSRHPMTSRQGFGGGRVL